MLSYENILKESKNIQMSSLKYQISKNEKTKIKIIDKLKALADQELNAIEKVIRIIWKPIVETRCGQKSVNKILLW